MNAIFIYVVGGDTMGSVNDITKIDTDHAGDTEEEEGGDQRGTDLF